MPKGRKQQASCERINTCHEHNDRETAPESAGSIFGKFHPPIAAEAGGRDKYQSRMLGKLPVMKSCGSTLFALSSWLHAI
jgi:hypothetical protein